MQLDPLFYALQMFLSVFFGRTLYLRLRKGINPITLGNKQRGWRQLVELAFPVWLALWTLEVVCASLSVSWQLFPAIRDFQIVDWLQPKSSAPCSLGAAC